MTSPIQAAKKTLRLMMKKRLTDLSTDIIREKSNRLCLKLLSSPEYQKSRRIAIYLSMKEEVDTSMIMEDILQSRDKKCFIPRYVGPKMDMLHLRDEEDFRSLPMTKWKIKQPADDDESRENALETGGLDLVVVPGLAFTKDRKRLGRGGGYYDRFLKRCSDCETTPYLIALAFSEQIVDDIPMDETDQFIDKVVIDDDN